MTLVDNHLSIYPGDDVADLINGKGTLSRWLRGHSQEQIIARPSLERKTVPGRSVPEPSHAAHWLHIDEFVPGSKSPTKLVEIALRFGHAYSYH